MVFVEPSKSFNVQGLWLDEKRNRFFLLQRHRAAQTALGSSLQLVRNVLGPASGADGYRIICSSSPYYQVASAFDQQEILQDWAWIEEHLMPLAEKMEGRDFRILVVKYFSDLAHGKQIHLPRIASVHVDLHRLADRQDEEGRRDLPDEEEIAVLGANNPEEDDAVDVVDLDDLGTSKGDDKWIGKIIGNEPSDSPSPLRKEQSDDTETLSNSNGTTTSDSSSEQQSDPASGSGADHAPAEPGVQWPGLRFLPEQYAHPEKAFGWLRSMARGTDFDGWRYLEEEAGVSFYRKQVEGPNGKRDMYKGVVVIDATAKNIFQMLNQVDKWPKWDRTLSQAQVLDRVDKKNEVVHLRFKKFFPAFSSLAQAVNMSKRAEKERDMVVFKSWGTHERDSYAIYFRSVEYDKLAPDADVIRMDTEGCGFIIEPMSSIFSAASFRSPLGAPSGLATASIVTFVSDINWKGWLTPIMGEYVHFTKVMLLKEVRNSFMPDLAFMGRKSATISDAGDDEPQETQQQQQQYSFQSAMKGFSSFIEQKKQRIIEERERRRHEGSSAPEDGGETETEGEGEIGMLDRLKAMFDTGKAAPNDSDVAGDAETAKTTDKGMWGQWKQALTFKNATTATSDDGAQAPAAEDLRDTAAATSPGPTPTEGNKGWLGMMKGALAPKTANGAATTPSAAAPTESATTEPATSEPAKKGTGGGWFDRMKGPTTASSAAPAEQTNGGSAWAGGSSWLNRMKESVTTATKTTTKKAPDGEQPTTEKGWLERMKEAVKVKDTGAPPPAGNDAAEPKTFTLKFTAVEDEPEGIKGKEAEHDEVLEEVTKQQNDSSAGLAHDDLTLS